MSAPDLSPAFYDAWTALSQRLGIDPLALARVSFAETSMYQRHPSNPNAGVWPFIESTLHRLGYAGTAQDFTALPPEQQIVPWLEKYLQPYRAYMKDDAMIYVAMFLPAKLPAAYAALSQGRDVGDAFVLTSANDGTGYYQANTILDRNHDGVTTVGDLRTHLDIQDQGSRWLTIESELRARGGGGSMVSPSNAIVPGAASLQNALAALRRRPALLALLAASAAGVWYFYYMSEGIRSRQNLEQRIDRVLSR